MNAEQPLWAISDLTVFFAVSKSTMNRIARGGDFPKPLQVTGTRGRRWIPAEAMAWAERQREY